MKSHWQRLIGPLQPHKGGGSRTLADASPSWRHMVVCMGYHYNEARSTVRTPGFVALSGAKARTRTADRTIFSRELYQLSYLGVVAGRRG